MIHLFLIDFLIFLDNYNSLMNHLNDIFPRG